MTVAAFDFDGTLTTRDNVLPFLRRVAGTARWVYALGAAAPAAVRRGRDAAKEALIARTLAGRDAAEVAAIGRELAADILRRHLRPSMVERVEWHRAQGHRLALVSGSLAPYIVPVGDHLGFDAVLCCELEVDTGGCLTGRLTRPNVRAAEKVRRLDEWLAGEPAELYAYGDNSGDDELLARADHPVRIRP